jgi:NTE family protein
MAKPQKRDAIRPGEIPVLVLQGGGALGAYQAGAYEELAAAGIEPKWVAGISIGAINAAIIAGNPPEKRLERLDDFWTGISSDLTAIPNAAGQFLHSVFNQAAAGFVALAGAPGFFAPRFPPAMFQPSGSIGALGIYDTSPLRATLERLVDFDRINARKTRLSVGAVNIRSGNFAYFDNTERTIGPEHIMASGALPPGFPPIEIDGEYYWDGGLVSNTPLQYVVDSDTTDDMVVFQVDLFGAQGPMPRNLSEAAEREKDIRFSSRTRLVTDMVRRKHAVQMAISNLLRKLPPELRNDPDVLQLARQKDGASISIVHLIYRRQRYETQSRDYEFSRNSVMDHWKSGRNDVRRTLRQKVWIERTRPEHGVAVFDLTRDATD